jgi:hypothetical protein
MKTAENFSFWTLFNSLVAVFGSQQDPQSGVLLTAVATWGT